MSIHRGWVGHQALIGMGSQGRRARATWMASMGRMPWLRLVTR